MGLEQRLAQITQNLREKRFANEQAVSQGVVLPILGEMSWDVFDTTVVWPEYATGEGRVDFALCDPPSSPKCFVEVKQPGKAEEGVRQALEYAFHSGVQFVVLTDGETWSFYLPAEQGSYEDRRVFKLDVLEHAHSRSEEILRRYLERKSVASGAALETARREYRSKSRRTLARQAIPNAWGELVSKADDLLIDMVAEAVESKVGIRPDDDDIANFLVNLSVPSSVKVPLPTAKAGQGSADPPTRPIRQYKGHAHGKVVLRGRSFPYSSAKDALTIVLRELAKSDPTFLERCSRHHAFSGKKRRYIARHLHDLYPGREDFESQHEELPGGWLVGTHSNNSQKMALVRAAAEVAGLTLDEDLIVEF